MRTNDYSTNILSIIERLAQTRVSLALTRLFKGILFKQDVRILSIEHDCAIVKVGDAKALAVPEGWIHLHNQLFPHPVRAAIVDRNVPKSILVLSDFRYIDTEWVERRDDRVQPKAPTYIAIRYNRKAYNAALEDIDVEGVGILATPSFGENRDIQILSKVSLDLPLTPGYTVRALPGTIMNYSLPGGTLLRLGIQLSPHKCQAQVLNAYIAHRKKEILDELDRAYCKALEPRRVEDLYF